MDRGTATRGKVAEVMAGAEAIEIKATVPEHQVEPAVARFGRSGADEVERIIYFFDTPKLDLLAAGIIARARRIPGGEHDSTVKFRPVNPSSIDADWRNYRGFKIEADASEKAVVKSASLSMPVAKGLIKDVVAGESPIASLFTQEQRKFLLAMATREIDYSSVSVLGPLAARRWRFEDPGCPWPITGELWTREDGERLLEVSIKAPIAQAAAAVAGFMAFLAEVGAERDTKEQTKTRWALDYYVAKLSPPAVSRPASKRKSVP